jgi:hypothetical protein
MPSIPVDKLTEAQKAAAAEFRAASGTDPTNAVSTLATFPRE